jgi:hypothetical protein
MFFFNLEKGNEVKKKIILLVMMYQSYSVLSSRKTKFTRNKKKKSWPINLQSVSFCRRILNNHFFYFVVGICLLFIEMSYIYSLF